MNFLRGGTHSIAARYSAAFLFAVLLCAPAHSSETVQLWVQSIFGAQQTHSHLKPFFDEFFTAVGRNYRPKYGNNFPALSRTCASEKYDVVMGSYGTAMRQFERECGYHVVALTDQSIYLYTRDRSSLENIRRVGVIPGVRASEVDLRKVLPGGFVVIPYRDHIQATVALLDGDIDGLTSSSVAIKRLAPVLQDSIHIAHTFDEKGHGVAMLSPRFYATPEGQAFRHFILANGETSVQIYVEEMGISRWRSPDKEKPATTAGSE